MVCPVLGLSSASHGGKDFECNVGSTFPGSFCWVPRQGHLGWRLWGSSGISAKESACSAGDLGSTPGLGRSPGEGNSHPFQCSGLENSMDCVVHVVKESDTTEQPSLSFSGQGGRQRRCLLPYLRVHKPAYSHPNFSIHSHCPFS